MKREVIYSVRGPKLLPEMTWEDVAEELKHTDLIIFPVAANEVHDANARVSVRPFAVSTEPLLGV